MIGIDVSIHHGREDMEEQSNWLPVPRKWVGVEGGDCGKWKKPAFSGFLFSSFIPSDAQLGDSTTQLTFRDGFPFQLLLSYHPP